MPQVSSHTTNPPVILWKGKLKKAGAITAIAAIYIWAARGIGFNLFEIIRELPQFFSLLGEMIPPNWGYTARVFPALLETVQIAVLATLVGSILAFPLTLFSANNINTNTPLYFLAKGFMNFIRTIPELLYASILVAGIGLGAFSGMLALTIFSTAVIAKLASESLEAIDHGPIEALQAVGANKLEVIRFAVVPQMLSFYASYTLYVFEINIRASTVLGLVGAGGVGVLLRTSLDLFRYANAATTILITFVFVMIIDYTSTRMRERLT
ncbi:phosphonate transport system permease protein [Alkalispirochaeta americana]|uniref:Phosphonate transport system permease protein n=1 Tax=Alkalispirochaeta americana TaxID=159291 RepID=A0A1N6VXB4_9SPIO|nr:phosphonate ABC transporter, permease protein PhnE [Alkalispirochaeta americana]SIQ82385.1 phosphonate transport system permease protein [Alkalispirochaeta americana]